ncbi:TM2 domain-containing protein [Homoserinibacter sp. YIM 151385]|uniref:TM2 domain-containing protein n=1 Tax=Homoserinibacter sp. YIM 151385 TaxID=2985506 RepID=UPI0022F09FEE|nr:TM2 domain-containing protein [Homoserinibacter sp. YIM 151385]WBU38269.1 TM2 domain-containing protein [Homoserinibacter sp. YIM 151385]
MTARDDLRELPSPKSFIVTWILSVFLGGLGIDRMYLGKWGTAILKLVTVGGFGFWYLLDVIFTLIGISRDAEGRRVRGSSTAHVVAWIVAILVLAGGGTGAGVTQPWQSRQSADAGPPVDASALPAPEAGWERISSGSGHGAVTMSGTVADPGAELRLSWAVPDSGASLTVRVSDDSGILIERRLDSTAITAGESEPVETAGGDIVVDVSGAGAWALALDQR